MSLTKFTLYPVIVMAVFCSLVLGVTFENSLADFSDEDEGVEQLFADSMGIKAVNTTSLEHLTALSHLYLQYNELTEFPDLTPVADTLKRLGLRNNYALTIADNVRLAVLKKFHQIDIRFTQLSVLTSTCPEDSEQQYWIFSDSLNLCDCQHVWLKVNLI